VACAGERASAPELADRPTDPRRPRLPISWYDVTLRGQGTVAARVRKIHKRAVIGNISPRRESTRQGVTTGPCPTVSAPSRTTDWRRRKILLLRVFATALETHAFHPVHALSQNLVLVGYAPCTPDLQQCRRTSQVPRAHDNGCAHDDRFPARVEAWGDRASLQDVNACLAANANLPSGKIQPLFPRVVGSLVNAA
jgi:hypothetical protein